MRTMAVVTMVVWIAACGGGSRGSSGGESAGETTTSAGRELPANPSRADVMQAIAEIQPDVVACLAPFPGQQVVVAITLESSGRTRGVAVERPSAGGDGGPVSDVEVDAGTASCIEAAAAGARVPPFSRETFLVRYPFRAR